MFKKNNLTDFEKLLFAEKQIEELKLLLKNSEIRNGVLLSEIDELKHLLKIEKPDLNKILNYKELIINQENKIKKYKKDYENLFSRFVKLQTSNL